MTEDSEPLAPPAGDRASTLDVGEIAARLAHDLNNCFAVVDGSVGLARREIESANPPGDALELLEDARDASREAGAIVERLLAWTGRLPLEAEPLDAGAILRNLADLLEQGLDDATEVALDLDAGGASVWTDRERLEIAILELATNAREAMPAGGILRLSAGPAEPGASPWPTPPGLAPGHYTVIAVADTGTGMDAGVAARACEPFFTTRPPRGGRGLGLSVVDGLARQCGGGLALATGPGAGTTACVWLPAHEPT